VHLSGSGAIRELATNAVAMHRRNNSALALRWA
jgi:hypothetical protein